MATSPNYDHLALSFDPQSIRDHFEADEINPTNDMTDAQLAVVGLIALQDDRLYELFHELLSEGVGARPPLTRTISPCGLTL